MKLITHVYQLNYVCAKPVGSLWMLEITVVVTVISTSFRVSCRVVILTMFEHRRVLAQHDHHPGITLPFFLECNVFWLRWRGGETSGSLPNPIREHFAFTEKIQSGI